MSERRLDRPTTLSWMADGTQLLLDEVSGLSDSALDGASALPRWSRRHIVAHVARNAEALQRLLAWARTGIPTPMYRSPTQRNEDIEASRGLPAERLRRELAETAADLADDAAGLTSDQWATTVRSAQGRDMPAADVPWMRSREVWLHALDLDTGVSPDRLPIGFCDELIEDMLGNFAAKTELALAVTSTSTGGHWRLGSDSVDAQVVEGPSAELVLWLSGRAHGTGLASADPLPELPTWL